ncbi:hypothetical protein K9L97_01140 [Candidatus Woesearchaeota archaeon]|nr:hypothetical protein [Candidatus Woesearchaeota archaeon]
MKNNIEDIRSKLLNLMMNCPIVGTSDEIHMEMNKFIYRLIPNDADNNLKVLSDIKQHILSIREKHKDEDILLETFNFIDSYLGCKNSFSDFDKTSNVPNSFLDALTMVEGDRIIRSDKQFNQSQLKTIALHCYNEIKSLCFTISRGTILKGKMVGVLRNGTKVKIPVMTLYQVSGGDNPQYAPYLFTDAPSRKRVSRELAGYFYIYKFVSESDELFIVLSQKKLDLRRYEIEGNVFEVKDSSLIAETSKIPVKSKVFFLHTAKSVVTKLKNHDELFSFCKDKGVTADRMLNYIVSINDDGKIKMFLHPLWFLQLLFIFLIHAKKGETDKFPLHLLWIADRGTGKTTCLEAIVQKFGEKIIDGSTSTLKYLIPSFKERNNPEIGALAVAVFIVGLDEFLRMFFKGKNDERNIDAARMNILLEHKERAAGSGHGATIVKMTARLIATTNPVAGTNNIYNLLDKVDDSFLSRMLIYYQLPEHQEFINESKKKRYTKSDFWLDEDDFISIIEYLSCFEASYDWDELIKLYELFSLPLSEEVKGMYEARYLHHLECMLDGVVKMRCLFEGDNSFTAKPEDYKLLEFIFGKIISSWFGDTRDLVLNLSIPAENRVNYLPEQAKVILDVLGRIGFKTKIEELKKACRSEMKESAFASMLSLLKTGHFIFETGSEVEHYAYHTEEQNERRSLRKT